MNRTTLAAALAAGLLVTGCTTPAEPTVGLSGTSWQVITIDGTPAAEGSMLAFADDNLSASAGCNRIGGTWSVTGSTLTTGPLMATEMYCEGRMEHEAALGTLLQGGAAIAVDGNRLALTGSGHRLEAVRKP